MANERLLTEINLLLENGAQDLGTLLGHVPGHPPKPEPAPKPTPGSGNIDDYYFKAGRLWEILAINVGKAVAKLGGTPAPNNKDQKSSDPVLLDRIVLSQICLCFDLKAMVMCYDKRLLSRLPIPPEPLFPYASEVDLIATITQWLHKESVDLESLLTSQGMNPAPTPPVQTPYADRHAAIVSIEASLTQMAQDLAFVQSHHPRHVPTKPRP